MAKKLFWAWLIIILVLNVIPLGNETSESLSISLRKGKTIFRADYLLHFISLLALAWVFILGQVASRPVFRDQSLQRFSLIVISAALGFELIQFVLPYRRFNPIDLGFNLSGAILGIIVVIVSSRLAKE